MNIRAKLKDITGLKILPGNYSILTLPALISEKCIKLKIGWSVFFHFSMWCLKSFYEGFLKAFKVYTKTFWGTRNKCENKNLD